MKSTETLDCIIVGQGLAGSCLALQLIKRGKKILVIDQYHEHAATQVAAGLFNPVTGRKMTKTWLADTLFPYLHTFYQEAEQLTGEKFFRAMPLYRPFVSVEEQNEWMGKSVNKDIADYIERVETIAVDKDFVKNDFGGLKLKQCGYLDTVKFSKAVRAYIAKHGELLAEKFEEDQLVLQQDGVQYKNYSASRIVFCQGVEVLASKFFSWLPIRMLKGETLTLKTSSIISVIYNRGVYVVPEIWKVGATYSPQDISPTITEAARTELQEKLDELVSFPYQITNQSWGMRPTTPDRRPILGAHPDHQSLVVFNGLGTKGVSLAPYFSKVLTNSIENNAPINKEVDIERYKHYNYGGIFPR